MTSQSLGEVKLTSTHPRMRHNYDIEEKYKGPFILLLTWCMIKPVTISQIIFLEVCLKNNKQVKYIKKYHDFSKFRRGQIDFYSS